MRDYMSELNSEQMRAVEEIERPLLILAGAGTGKTKTIVSRALNIVECGINEENILIVTFTNKAANEIKERISHALDHSEGECDMWLGTFHSIASKILRSHSETVGLSSRFTILDMDDQKNFINNVLEGMGYKEKFKSNGITAIHAASEINNWKNKRLMPSEVSSGDIKRSEHHVILELYERYQKELIACNYVDFEDLLLHNITIFQKDAEALRFYQDQFKYVMIDEYQDTNHIQYEWVKLVCGGGNSNICCVGDEDQSIYSWRGAQIGNILNFQSDFSECEVIRLEQNYRSTNYILKAASSVISNNNERIGKTLYTKFDSQEKVKLMNFFNDIGEAQYICNVISKLILEEKVREKNDVAILVRSAMQMRVIEEQMISCGIPYRIVGGIKFYERKEIKDALSYLRIVINPHDHLAFERIINSPKRGVGKVTLANIYRTSLERGVSVVDAVSYMLENKKIKGKAGEALNSLLMKLSEWEEIFDSKKIAEIMDIILKESGYLEYLKSEMNCEDRISNINELIRVAEGFDDIAQFLEHANLASSIDEKDKGSAVNIMTVHSAKGLEFECVFLPGWEEGMFPHYKCKDNIQEERRLAYVGITRAKKLLYISYAHSRFMHNVVRPCEKSVFIDELPEDCIEVVHDHKGRVRDGYRSGYRGSRYKTYERPARKADDSVKVGMFVNHSKFGRGQIACVERSYVEVEFPEWGAKKIMTEYIKK